MAHKDYFRGLLVPLTETWVTTTEAAERLGVKPWDVVRMAEIGVVKSVLLIDADSLDALKEQV
jgi:hypothetical protein